MMKYLTRFLAALALVALLPIAQLLADSGSLVTQTEKRLDAATGLFGPAGGATACATVNTTVANNTVTIPAISGKYIYIKGVYIDIRGDATGTTGVATMSTTNLTGGPIWSLSTIAVATVPAGGARQVADVFPGGLKSAATGVAVTFVPSAQIANEIVCTRVAAYYSDN